MAMLDQVSDPKREALRIQAAAVAAQQAALTEEEIRLHKRRVALEQHEAQLSGHLDEKRRRLIDLRTEARQAQTALEQERAAFEARVQDMTARLAEARAETEVYKQQALTERQRLLELRQRLKKRWHRHWAAERAAMKQREAELAQARRQLEQDQADIGQQQEALNQARLWFNGETELGRRRLQDGWNKLHQEQEQWQRTRRQEQTALRQQARQLTEREWGIHAAIRTLAEERRRCQVVRLHLEHETAGLEARIANQRRQLLDNEAALARQQPIGPVDESDRTPAVAEVLEAVKSSRLLPSRQDLMPRLAALEKLSTELADQRVHLTEQCERLLQTQQRWEQDRDQAAAELEQAGERLRERERTLAARERELEEALGRYEQQQADSAYVRRYLESWQARLTLRAAAWEGERERLLADVEARERLASRRLNVLLQIGRRWQERRQEEVRRLQAQYAVCEQLRQGLEQARQEWLDRHEILTGAQRNLAERLALLDRSVVDPMQFDQESDRTRLKLFQKKLVAINTTAEKALAREYQTVRTEAARIEERFSQVQQHVQAVMLLESQHAEQQRGRDLGHRQL